MLDFIVSALLLHWPIAILLVIIAWLATNHFNKSLRKYPGPFLASLTDWWRFFDVLGRRPDITHNALHKKHGNIVRYGPNALSFADPKALKDIYGLNKGFIKSGFYPVQQAVSKGERLPSLFSTTDEQYHAELRRSINGAFSMTALVQYEPSVDSTTSIFLDQTDRLYASQNRICDFAQWLQFYAFDVIGEITYSKRHGFVDRAEDVDGIVRFLGRLFSYVAPVGQVPYLDVLLLKNPILRYLDKHNILSFTTPIVTFAKARMAERLNDIKIQKALGVPDPEKPINGNRRGDLLTMFLKAKNERPGFFNDARVLTMAVSMAFAGSETTAISLAAVFYYLLKNPRRYEKLVKEIDDAVEAGQIENRPDGIVSWSESQTLPYLDACIKEAFRLHPAPGLVLERIVPPEGANICGESIPGGTIVGCNPWVIHRRPEIFGADVEKFRPERWIEADKEQKKMMDSSMLHFSMGARTCIGKNISLLEMYKIIPAFLRRFEVRLAFPDQEWKLHNAWFVKQYNFNATFKARIITP